MNHLPAWIVTALDERMERVSRVDLARRAQMISETYRTGGDSHVIRSDLDALAYAIVRMPATFSAVGTALEDAAGIDGVFAPQSVLDIGAGPGTATWASRAVWPSIRHATLLDCNPSFLDLAKHMNAASDDAGMTLEVVRGTVPGSLADAPSADLVLASYALNEVTPSHLPDVLSELWRLTQQVLVLVEPGTPDGFRRILQCRDVLLAAGATIIAPCSHEGGCPLTDTPRWCHFSKRLPRSRDHRLVKGASAPYEDEKYTYLIVGRGRDVTRGRRVLATPKVTKAQIGLTLCAPSQVEERMIERGDKDRYKAAKRADWGDIID